MLDVKASNTICSLVDFFLRRDDCTFDESFTQRTAHGIVITLYCSMSYYTNNYNYNARREVIMLFTGNTSVFVAIPESGEWYPGWSAIPQIT